MTTNKNDCGPLRSAEEEIEADFDYFNLSEIPKFLSDNRGRIISINNDEKGNWWVFYYKAQPQVTSTIPNNSPVNVQDNEQPIPEGEIFDAHGKWFEKNGDTVILTGINAFRAGVEWLQSRPPSQAIQEGETTNPSWPFVNTSRRPDLSKLEMDDQSHQPKEPQQGEGEESAIIASALRICHEYADMMSGVKFLDEQIDKFNELVKLLNGGMKPAPALKAKQDQSRAIKAAKQLLHLHLCEQEGLLSGQPTKRDWLMAVDELSEAIATE